MISHSHFFQNMNESILDMIHLANEHLVVMWTSAFPKREWKCSEVVASTDVEKVSAQIVHSMTTLVCDTIQNYGNGKASLFSAGNVVDAHSSNWKGLLAVSSHSARNFLPKELMDEFPVIDFAIVHVVEDLVTGRPVVQIPDLLHLTKNVVTALKYSWLGSHKRWILYKGCLFHLGFVKDCWVVTGGGTNQLHPTKLTWYHFLKDANSRMDCPMSMHVLSGSVARLMNSIVDDDDIQVGSLKNKIC